MAYRFTSTEKWRDKWYRGLSPESKLTWEYLRDSCNNAGFIEIDEASIAFHTGIEKENIDAIIKGLKRGFIGAKKGHDDWFWIKNFLKHQKNLPLSVKNPAHKQIIFQLNEQSKRFDLNEIVRYLGADPSLFKWSAKKPPAEEPAAVDPISQETKDQQFELFWSKYGKKVGLKKAKSKFMKLKDSDIVKIFEKLPAYIMSTPDPQYRMNPEVYLNGERWNDQVIHKVLAEGGGKITKMHSVIPDNNKGGAND